MNQKTALIIGVTGQDGLYLTEFLIKKNYRVVGMIQRGLEISPALMSYLNSQIQVTYGDLVDIESLMQAIQSYQPDEVYNLAALTHAGDSWRLAIETAEITGLGAHRVFEAVRQVKKDSRVFQASSSDMFGRVKTSQQNEETPFAPVNPYGAAKLYAHTIAQVYRNSHNMFVACAILFNHESPRRGLHFLMQKVAYGAACIKLGIQNSPDSNEQGEPIVKDGKIALGNLDSKRDWGFAGDYVEAMWLMLQQEKPDDFVIGTGTAHSVKELCENAFGCVGLDWQKYVVVDPRFLRPTETGATVADASKAKRILGWSPHTPFSELVKMMVEHQIEVLNKK